MTIRWVISWFLIGILGFSLLTSCDNYKGSFSRDQPVDECHIFQHKFGETCVPSNPQRIVTLSLPTLGNAISLGVKPIGSTYIADWYYAPYLDGKLDGIGVLGNERTNFEKLLLLKPDLIVGLDWEEAVYSLLSEIAPTALDDWGGTENWRKHFNFVAEVLGKQEEAQQVWNNYYQRIRELKKALNNRYNDKTISLVFMAPGVIFSEVKGSFPDSILKDVGLQRPTAQDVIARDSQLQFGEETLEIADGDFLFIGGLTRDEKDRIQELEQQPLWQKLRAVQEGHVYIIDYVTWRGGNLIAADAVIDDLFKYLVNTS